MPYRYDGAGQPDYDGSGPDDGPDLTGEAWGLYERLMARDKFSKDMQDSARLAAVALRAYKRYERRKAFDLVGWYDDRENDDSDGYVPF